SELSNRINQTPSGRNWHHFADELGVTSRKDGRRELPIRIASLDEHANARLSAANPSSPAKIASTYCIARHGAPPQGAECPRFQGHHNHGGPCAATMRVARKSSGLPRRQVLPR